MKDLTRKQLVSTYKGANKIIDAIHEIDNDYNKGTLNEIYNRATKLRSNAETEWNERMTEQIPEGCHMDDEMFQELGIDTI